MRTVATLLLAGMLAGNAAAAPPTRGKLLFERSGVIERSGLHVTQDTFVVHNRCRGTDLNGTETNGLSAAVLDVSKYRGQYLSVAFTAESPAVVGWYSVRFYTHDCQVLVDELDSTPHQSQEGRIPTRATWLLVGHSGGSTDPTHASAGRQLTWKVTVHALPPLVPPPPKKALCQQVRDPKGDEPVASFDILSADVAVDATAVTVGLRLAEVDFAETAVPARSYLVEFTVPDGRTFFLGMRQRYPFVAGLENGFQAISGTKDATGYHLSYYPTYQWIDSAINELRVSATLARPADGESIGTVAKFDRGKRLTGITARTVDGPIEYPQLEDERDVATTKAPYVIGTPTCLQRVAD